MNRIDRFLIAAGTQPQRTRRGATLVEVLMALLIMAVGVTSVVTLFPLAIMKAVKAHQLTDAKLYENAIKDTLLTHSQLWTGAPEWSENTVYGQAPSTANVQDRWVAPKRSERLVPDTNELFFCPPNSPAGYLSGSRMPNLASMIRQDWNGNLFSGGYENRYVIPPGADANRPAWWSAVSDSSLAWYAYRHSPYLANTLWSAYVVDPLGWHNAATNPERIQFGQIPTGTFPYGDSSGAANTINMDRIHCQLSLSTANEIFRLPDTWNMVVEPTPLDVSPGVTFPAAGTVQIEFPSTIDVTGLTPLKNRVILSSTQSKRVVTVPITLGTTNPSSNVLRIPNSTLPTGFAAIADQASVEVQSPSRYSWLMAVHSSPQGKFEAQCAVVLNRTYQVADEQGYRAEFMQQFDLDGDGSIGTNETNIAKVRWPFNADADAPRIKEGGYIFDASYGYWYQIKKIEKINGEAQQLVEEDDDLYASGDKYVRTIVTLNDQVKVSSGTNFTDYQIEIGASKFDCHAVLLPGVIHVFSMTPESPQ